jgi:putative glutamine amidotransferase
MTQKRQRIVGITQRVEVIAGRDEARDCLDQAWAMHLMQIGIMPVPLSNRTVDPTAYLDALSLDGLILSGGNDLDPASASHAPERDRFETLALQWAETAGCPTLGICRGMQMMVQHLGGRISLVEHHVARQHRVLGGHRDQHHVNSFHNYGVLQADLPSELEALGLAEDGTVEAMRHRTRPWLGLMWHPERAIDCPETDWAVIADLFRSRS